MIKNWLKKVDVYNRLGLREPEVIDLPKDLGEWEPKIMYPSLGEIDALGARLDSVRATLANTVEGTWAHTHWSNQHNELVRRWKRLVVEIDIGIHRSFVPESWKINMNWYEVDGDGVPNILLMWLDDKFRSHEHQEGLQRSWDNAKRIELEKARMGYL